MSNEFVFSSMNDSAMIAPDQSMFDELFSLFKHEIFKSLLYTFEMDFLMNDQHGGPVDTIHNVRQIGEDPRMVYKNAENALDYYLNKLYDSDEYHKDSQYIEINANISERKKQGTLVDSYTGKKTTYGDRVDLDHIISAKEIHEDRGRILSEESGVQLANSPDNLTPTDRSINRSMKQKDIADFVIWLEKTKARRQERISELSSKSFLTDKERKELTKLKKLEQVNPKLMLSQNAKARIIYEHNIAKSYYTGKKFRSDLAKAATTEGIKIGIKQAIGFLFSEIVFAVIDEMDGVSFDLNLDLGDFFTRLSNGINKGFENAKIKYKDLFERFFNGAITGALSSVTTTICNIFFTTAKNVVKIIRRSWSTIVKATEIVFLNPDGYLLGDRMKAVVTVIATGASMISGALVSEALEATPLGAIPFHDLVETFCGALVSGLLSCTFVFFIDKSENVKKLVSVLNDIPTMDYEVQYYRQQAEFFENYAAKLMEYDLEKFREETSSFNFIPGILTDATTPESLNNALLSIYEKLGMDIPWKDYDSFDDFMLDPNSEDTIG